MGKAKQEVKGMDSNPPRLTATISRKISTGNYESVDLFVSLSVDLLTDEHPTARLDAMHKILEEYMGFKEREVLDAVGKKNNPTLFELLLKTRQDKNEAMKGLGTITVKAGSSPFKKLPGSK